MTAKQKRHALQFTQPGAPLDFCEVVGVPALFHPQHPTPVGGDGEIPLEIARLFDKDPGCPVKLVTISDAQAKEYGEQVDHHRRKAGR